MKNFLVSVGVLALFPLSAFAQSFTDVSETHQFYDEIQFVQNEGIVNGYQDGSYKPEAEINRAEFTKIVIESVYSDEEINNCYIFGNTFADIENSDWFAKYVCVAKKEGIVNGYGDGMFKPENTITKGESAKVLVHTIMKDEVLAGDGGCSSISVEEVIRVINGGTSTHECIGAFTDQNNWWDGYGKIIRHFGWSKEDSGLVEAGADLIANGNVSITRGELAYFIAHTREVSSDGDSFQGGVLLENEKIAVIQTNKGEITLRFFPEVAPKSVENFIGHSESGYYDDVIFHRVIESFMIQGGDPTGTGMGGESIWGGKFEDEFSSEFSNRRGSISMANAGEGTNGSQFFINTVDNVFLDNRHSVFGEVISGMEIVDSISKVATGNMDKPIDSVVIKSIDVMEYKDFLKNESRGGSYDLFGNVSFTTSVQGYFESEKVDRFGENIELAYFVITDFEHSEFKDGVEKAIEQGNTVNYIKNGSHYFSLGCLGNDSIDAPDTEIDINTGNKILYSTITEPINLQLSFEERAGKGCICCNLAKKIEFIN